MSLFLLSSLIQTAVLIFFNYLITYNLTKIKSLLGVYLMKKIPD